MIDEEPEQTPRDDVPEADWAEQRADAEPEQTPTAPVRLVGTAEADAVDVADQEIEVVLDDED